MNIEIPAAILLKSDTVERKIRLGDCHISSKIIKYHEVFCRENRRKLDMKNGTYILVFIKQLGTYTTPALAGDETCLPKSMGIYSIGVDLL